MSLKETMSAKRRKSHLMVTRLDSACSPERIFDSGNEENEPPTPVNREGLNLDGKSRDVHMLTSSKSILSSSMTDSVRLESELVSPSKYGGIAFSSKSSVTVPKPFSFEVREMELLRKRKLLAEEAEKRAVAMANSFRARPMRVGSPDPLPQRSIRPPVRPTPFNFQVEERINYHKSRRQESDVSDNSAVQSSRIKSPSVVHRPPFVPLANTRPPLVARTPKLATSERAVQRSRFDEMIQRRRHSMESKREALEAERKAKEEEQIKRLREELVHKPQPIRRYKSVRVVERKPLTNARSPNFSIRGKTSTSSKQRDDT